MPVIIKQARNTAELNDVLELRWRAAALEFHADARSLGRWIDHFDIYPTTASFIAYWGGKAIGTIRVCAFDSSDGNQNAGYDFAKAVDKLEGEGPVFFLDMLAIHVDAGGTLSEALVRHLVSGALHYLAGRGARWVLFLAPQALGPILTSIEFHAIHEVMPHGLGAKPMIPYLGNVEEHYHKFLAQISDREIARFNEVSYRVLFEAGEVMVVQGERGRTAYLVCEGEVEVVIAKENEIIPIGTVGPGQLTGEVAMITNEPRTASLIAKKLTAAVAFDREEFIRLMYRQPEKSLDVFKLFSKRLSSANERLAAAQARSP